MKKRRRTSIAPAQINTIESVRADLQARGLGGYVKEVVNLDGDIAIRLTKGAPTHVKRAVGEVLR